MTQESIKVFEHKWCDKLDEITAIDLIQTNSLCQPPKENIDGLNQRFKKDANKLFLDCNDIKDDIDPCKETIISLQSRLTTIIFSREFNIFSLKHDEVYSSL